MAHFNYLGEEEQNELQRIADALVAPGKGILSADESKFTIENRLEAIDAEMSDVNVDDYGQLFFQTNESLKEYVNGVILCRDIYNRNMFGGGESVVSSLKYHSIIPGIRIDRGVAQLQGTEDEATTQGLDDLPTRCEQYKEKGFLFAKWRCVLKIKGQIAPSPVAISENANVLARFASECQKVGMVPVLEPEISPRGDHSLEMCQEVTEKVLAAVYKALSDHHVFLEGTLLKMNMVTPGYDHGKDYDPESVARATLTTVQRTVPVAVPGILFSCSGLSEQQASLNLNAINTLPGKRPWRLTFSYGRALKASALRVWLGEEENIRAGQDEFLKRARANSQASVGEYAGDVVGPASEISVFHERVSVLPDEVEDDVSAFVEDAISSVSLIDDMVSSIE